MMTTVPLAASDLLGAWRLLSLEHRLGTGQWEDAGTWQGRLLYGEGATVSILLVLESNDPSHTFPAPDELVSYFGTFELDRSVIQHRIELAARPSWTGTTQVRPARLVDGKLELVTPEFSTSRGLMQSRLRWSRDQGD